MGERGYGTRVVEVVDERTGVADAALRLFEQAFEARDRQPAAELRSEIEEKRRRLLTTTDYHLMAAVDPGGRVAGAISGVYLAGSNAGFVYYLVVDASARGQGIGRGLRTALIHAFLDDAARAGESGLAWVMGEVREDNPWLRRLVRQRGAIPFDLRYYHPGMHAGDSRRYVLYRQPIDDDRAVLSAGETGRVLYQIYRRAYRVRYPLRMETFRAMIEEAESKGEVGMHPAFPGEADED